MVSISYKRAQCKFLRTTQLEMSVTGLTSNSVNDSRFPHIMCRVGQAVSMSSVGRE